MILEIYIIIHLDARFYFLILKYNLLKKTVTHRKIFFHFFITLSRLTDQFLFFTLMRYKMKSTSILIKILRFEKHLLPKVNIVIQLTEMYTMIEKRV